MQKNMSYDEASNMYGTEKYINFGRNDWKEIDNLEDTQADGRMKFQYTVQKWSRIMWTVLIWLRILVSGEIYELRFAQEAANLFEWECFLNKLLCLLAWINPYPTAFPYGNGMVLHFYQQQESSTTKTVHKVINKGLKTYV